MPLQKLFARTAAQQKHNLVPLVTPAQRTQILTLQSRLGYLMENSDAPMSDKYHDGVFTIGIALRAMTDVNGYMAELTSTLEHRGLKKDQSVPPSVYKSIQEALYTWDGVEILAQFHALEKRYAPPAEEAAAVAKHEGPAPAESAAKKRRKKAGV